MDRLIRGTTLLHLVANAIKFTERGGVFLKVEVEACHEDAAPIRFTITDTGIGIRCEQLKKLFSPFEQADTSSTRRYGGSGLGLSISKQLVEMMGGEIGVDSNLGQGSTFWFTAVFHKNPQSERRGHCPVLLASKLIESNEGCFEEPSTRLW